MNWDFGNWLRFCLFAFCWFSKFVVFSFWIKQWRSLKDSWQGTMIMGADVCHKVAGISVAAVLGSTDFSYVTWPDPLQWEIEKIWKQIVRIFIQIHKKVASISGYILICHLIAPPHSSKHCQQCPGIVFPWDSRTIALHFEHVEGAKSPKWGANCWFVQCLGSNS